MITTGKVMASILVLTAVIGGGGMWYMQEYAFYKPADVITELPAVTAAGHVVALKLSSFSGIDATSSPIRWRGCMQLADPLPDDLLAPFADPTPLVAPRWFDCFDAGELTAALADGRAKAYVVDPEIRPDVDRVIAVYPDGRAFGWNQINDKTPERGVMD